MRKFVVVLLVYLISSVSFGAEEIKVGVKGMRY